MATESMQELSLDDAATTAAANARASTPMSPQEAASSISAASLSGVSTPAVSIAGGTPPLTPSDFASADEAYPQWGSGEEQHWQADLSAGEVLAREISSLMNHSDCLTMIETQHDVYKRLHESHQALRTFNDYSAKMYSVLGPDFEKNTKMLLQMRKDLELISKRIKYAAHSTQQHAARYRRMVG